MQLHSSLRPGDTFPAYRELIGRMDASERAVRWALDELVRQGKIVRRQGARSFVAEGNGDPITGDSGPQSAEISNRTIVALGRPDQGFFDHAMRLLYDHVEANELSLQCHFLGGMEFPLPAPQERPLGYIVFRGDLHPLACRLQDAGHRVVLVGTPRTYGELGVPNVYGNHEQGGLLATRHLLELGHRRIAFYGDPELASSARLNGHERALNEFRKRGETVQSEVITYDQFAHWRTHPQEARAYFARTAAPTGIVTWNDTRAVEMLSLLNFIGLRVPQDISLVGYDNLPESRRIFPALTTVDANLDQQLEAALGVLTQPEAASVPPVIITLPALIRRDSSAPVSN